MLLFLSNSSHMSPNVECSLILIFSSLYLLLQIKNACEKIISILRLVSELLNLKGVRDTGFHRPALNARDVIVQRSQVRSRAPVSPHKIYKYF